VNNVRAFNVYKPSPEGVRGDITYTIKMEKLKVSGHYAHAVECEGHPTLVFDNKTNVLVVVYLTITSIDGNKHPFTLLITDENFVEDSINELIQSYGDNYSSVEVFGPLFLNTDFKQSN